MELQTFIDNHFEDGEVYSEDTSIQFNQVYFDEYTEHKTVTFTEVHQLIVDGVATDEYFEISTDRDNCGYWGDGERYDPEFRKVKPVIKVVEQTTWVGV